MSDSKERAQSCLTSWSDYNLKFQLGASTKSEMGELLLPNNPMKKLQIQMQDSVSKIRHIKRCWKVYWFMKSLILAVANENRLKYLPCQKYPELKYFGSIMRNLITSTWSPDLCGQKQCFLQPICKYATNIRFGRCHLG